jgi:hypothetical protein
MVRPNECRLSGIRHVGFGSGVTVPAAAKQTFARQIADVVEAD